VRERKPERCEDRDWKIDSIEVFCEEEEEGEKEE